MSNIPVLKRNSHIQNINIGKNNVLEKGVLDYLDDMLIGDTACDISRDTGDTTTASTNANSNIK